MNFKKILMPIPDLENYIQLNGHLPNMPIAANVKENGIDVEQINVILVQKVEELTLYMLQLQKQIDELKKKIK